MRKVFHILRKEGSPIRQVMLPGRSLGGEGRLDSLRAIHLQRTVNLIGGDVIEALPLVFLGEGIPPEPGGLQQAQGPQHVRPCERERVLDAAVNVALSSQMDDAIDILLPHQFVHPVEIADVSLDERIVRPVLDVLEVGKIAGIGQLIDIDDMIVGILRHEKAHYVRANETGSSGDDDRSFVHLLNNMDLRSCGRLPGHARRRAVISIIRPPTEGGTGRTGSLPLAKRPHGDAPH